MGQSCPTRAPAATVLSLFSGTRPGIGLISTLGTALESACPSPVEEIGGPKGLEPTRYGDWERKGRAVDF
jgi:hypothetical protein